MTTTTKTAKTTRIGVMGSRNSLTQLHAFNGRLSKKGISSVESEQIGSNQRAQILLCGQNGTNFALETYRARQAQSSSSTSSLVNSYDESGPVTSHDYPTPDQNANMFIRHRSGRH